VQKNDNVNISILERGESPIHSAVRLIDGIVVRWRNSSCLETNSWPVSYQLRIDYRSRDEIWRAGNLPVKYGAKFGETVNILLYMRQNGHRKCGTCQIWRLGRIWNSNPVQISLHYCNEGTLSLTGGSDLKFQLCTDPLHIARKEPCHCARIVTTSKNKVPPFPEICENLSSSRLVALHLMVVSSV